MEHRSGVRLTLLVLACLACGCSSSRKQPNAARLQPKPQPPPEPWIKADSFCVLPLSEARFPPSGVELAESIHAAYAKTIFLNDATQTVTIEGGSYPSVQTMQVDLSRATTTHADRGGKPKPIMTSTPALTVEDFSLVATPLRSAKSGSSVNFAITGEQVRFNFLEDTAGNGLLMMTDASAGTLHFDASVREMERGMLLAAKERPNGFVKIRDLRLDFRTVGPRSIDATLYVSTLVGLAPAGLRFTARVDVDERMYATIRHVDVSGDDLLGPIIALFIRPKLEKYDGKTRPLMSFPNAAVRLQDVRISAGERITLDAVFGR